MCCEFTEDAYKIRIRIDDEPANLDILDTAGQVRNYYSVSWEGVRRSGVVRCRNRNPVEVACLFFQIIFGDSRFF